LLRDAGFHRFERFPSLDGGASGGEEGLFVFVGRAGKKT
jgi:hypothetical protein